MSHMGSKTNSIASVVFDSKSHALIGAGGRMVSENHRSYTLRELIAWNLPDGDVRWHVVERAKERISDLAIRPTNNELATKCTGAISIWSFDGKPLRSIESDFLAGPIVFSASGELLVAPQGNVIKVRSSDSGQVVKSLPISKSNYTSAKAAAFVPGTSWLLVAAQVIGAKGQVSGQLLLIDIDRQEVIKTSAIEISPGHMVVDPHAGWAGIAGERRNRGYLLLWDLKAWKCVAEQRAHGSSLDSVVVSPDGAQLATTGTDHVIRLWDPTTGKTIAKLDKHTAEDKSRSCLAWSPNGEYLAFASSGVRSPGCVAVYARIGADWKLHEFDSSTPKTLGTHPDSAPDVRPLRRFGKDEKMASQLSSVRSEEHGAAEWLRQYLDKNRSKLPLTTVKKIKDWERKHNISLPPSYVEFVTTVRRKSFSDVMGREGYKVRILGPKRLDAHEYRGDPPESESDLSEPDGLLFAVAINGDGFCFDLRGDKSELAVVHFDHETESFEPFANSFAEAIRRFVEQS